MPPCNGQGGGEMGVGAGHQLQFGLHGWTHGIGEIGRTIEAASAAGYDAIELSWHDFEEVARPPSIAAIKALLHASAMSVAAIGIKPGWLFAAGEAFDSHRKHITA